MPYVCIGYHRRLDEVDLGECRLRGLPVYRRMVGGGPVYLDDGQLFFQVTVPAASLPPVRARALRRLLSPAVDAFRAVGVDARLDGAGEIVVDDRKVCGHGAGQIGDAVVVVGNLIERFDHDRATAVLRAPSPAARAEVRRLMGRYVAATPADPGAFRDAAVHAYACALDLTPEPGSLTAGERERLQALDRRFMTPGWLAGGRRPAPPVWQAKIRAGVWVAVATQGPTSVLASVVSGRLERVVVSDPDLNGSAPAVGDALTGRRLRDVDEVLTPLGAPGERVTAVLAGIREAA